MSKERIDHRVESCIEEEPGLIQETFSGLLECKDPFTDEGMKRLQPQVDH